MQIGAMNHPARPLADELRWMAKLGLDFVDLTLEPPAAAAWDVKAQELRELIAEHRLDVVGHTAYYLPIGSSFESLRRAALDELKRCIEKFATIGARWMNVHPDGHAPFIEERVVVERNVASLRELVEFARGTGVAVMVENVPGRFNNAEQLAAVLEPVPQLGLHL
ncbi:MAG TPA: TIM barrel protein, partial [Candidatus Synoicihabitans sp.]|nr:TIM barrel protein [Candidatus Synoicihabitans sp.]